MHPRYILDSLRAECKLNVYSDSKFEVGEVGYNGPKQFVHVSKNRI